MSYLPPELKLNVLNVAVSCYINFLSHKENLMPSIVQDEAQGLDQEDDFFFAELEVPQDPEKLEAEKTKLHTQFINYIKHNLYLVGRNKTLVNEAFSAAFNHLCAYHDWSCEFEHMTTLMKVDHFRAVFEQHLAQRFTFKLEGPHHLGVFTQSSSSGSKKRLKLMETIVEGAENLTPEELNTYH